MDYKTTLNLPKTDFPMKANLSKNEPEIIKKWEEKGIYNKIWQPQALACVKQRNLKVATTDNVKIFFCLQYSLR